MDLSDVVFRPFVPGDEVAINRTFNEVFHLQRPLAEWSWKYPPLAAGRAIMLAVAGDQVLAHYAALPARFQVAGREWEAAQIADVFSTRAARKHFARRGVWVKTVEEFFATFGDSGRYPLLYGFPGRRALRLGVLQLGYDAVEPQPITYLRRDPCDYRPGHHRWLYRAELARDWEPRLDQLWQRVRASYPVAVVRNAERHLYRLAGHPSARYDRFLVFPRFSPTPVAFAAFRRDGGVCRWVELVWDHAHRGALELLSRLSARLARAAAASHEELWLSGDASGQAVLESLGFCTRPEPNGLVLVARSFASNLDVGTLADQVYLTMADADLV